MKTPALNFLAQKKLPYKIYHYECTKLHDFAKNAAASLGIDEHKVYKTIMLETNDKKYVTCIMPAFAIISFKNVARCLKVKSVKMCDEQTAQKISGYVIGGISPFGQKRAHLSLLDNSALEQDEILVSGGERGLSVGIAPQDLIQALNAIVDDFKDHGKI